MAARFIIWSGDTHALTAPLASIASGASAGVHKTIQQLVPPAAGSFRVIRWGYIADAVPASPFDIDLVETGSVAATVTAHVSGSLTKLGDHNATSQLQLGTALTGYNASAEGTITATRLLDARRENGLYMAWPFELGREPEIWNGNVLRVRVAPTTAAAINLRTFVVVEE